jgi:hypothetical protein
MAGIIQCGMTIKKGAVGIDAIKSIGQLVQDIDIDSIANRITVEGGFPEGRVVEGRALGGGIVERRTLGGGIVEGRTLGGGIVERRVAEGRAVDGRVTEGSAQPRDLL